MSSANTSYWLSFFRDSGVPDPISTKYAVLFSNERINPSMLGELSKDILKDMGITAMGDIISILRHARATVEKDTQNKTLEGMVRTTPAGRTIAHYVGGNTKRKDVVRLGGSAISKQSVTETKPLEPLRRRVTPEIEGSYKVIMPKGTTPKTRAILQAIAESKKAKNDSMVADKTSPSRSVFDRLANSKPPPFQSSFEQNSVNAREKLVRTKGNGSSKSVFRRLGPHRTRSANTSPQPSSEITEYAGVLKLGAKRRLEEARPAASSAMSPTKRTAVSSSMSGVVRAEATSTTLSEGIFAKGLNRIPTSSVRDRLGAKVTAGSSMQGRSGGIKARLGTKSAFK